MISANVNGAIYGFTQSIMSYANAAVFSLGAYLIANNKFGTNFEKLLVCYSVIIFGAFNAGKSFDALLQLDNVRLNKKNQRPISIVFAGLRKGKRSSG